MLLKTTTRTPIYQKSALSGERKSEFVPSGGFLEAGEVVEVSDNVQSDESGRFAEMVDQPGNFVFLMDTQEAADEAA